MPVQGRVKCLVCHAGVNSTFAYQFSTLHSKSPYNICSPPISYLKCLSAENYDLVLELLNKKSKCRVTHIQLYGEFAGIGL